MPHPSQTQALKRLEQRRTTCARSTIEKERLSRLTQLAPLVTSYESLSQKQKAEISTSLQSITEGSPVGQHRVDETPFKLETDGPKLQSDYLLRCDESPSISPRSVTQNESVDSTLDRVVSDLECSTTITKDSESLPAQIREDQINGSLTCNPSQVSSMLATLYLGFLASVQRMGALLSPRTVIPRPEEQDDETKVTQELSQAQRLLVAEEEWIWKRLLEVASEGETAEETTIEEVSLLAHELEGKSAKILTSYERHKNPPPGEVYCQSRIVLQAMGVPCIDAEGGIEGEALASAIVRDGFADVVASEDTVGHSSSL